MASSDQFSNSETGQFLNSLQRIDWSKDPQTVISASQINLELLQKSFSDNHGVVPIIGKKYEAIVVSNKVELFNITLKENNPDPIYAIPVSGQVAIMPSTDPDNAVLFSIAKDDEFGSKILITKSGLASENEQQFTSITNVDADKLTQAKEIMNSAYHTLDLDTILKREEESRNLKAEAIQTTTKDYEQICPTIDNNVNIPIKYKDLSLRVLGIDLDTNFLLIQFYSDFQIQTF